MWGGPPSGQRLRPLRLMRMIRAGVDLQLAELLGAEAVVRQHAFDRPADDFLRAALEEVAEGLLLVALGVAAMADVELRLELVAADRDPGSIEDDHVVPRIEVRSIGRLVLAYEDMGDPRCEAAERFIRRIDDVPASVDLALTRRVGLRGHDAPSSPSNPAPAAREQPVAGTVPAPERLLRRGRVVRLRAPRRPRPHPSCRGRPSTGRPRSVEPFLAGRHRPGRRSSRPDPRAEPGPRERPRPAGGPEPRKRRSR